MLEAWLWDHLGPVVARIVGALPLARLQEIAARGIRRLHPYATLVLFVLPGLALFPFKLAGLWLIARGHVIAGAAVFFLAKTVGLGFAAFLYELCRDKLMQIPLFVRAHALVQRLRAWAHAQTEPARRVLLAIRRRIARHKSRFVPLLLRWRRKHIRRA